MITTITSIYNYLAIKAQLGSDLGPNEVAELVSHSTLKLDEIELLMDSSAMRLRVINEAMDEVEKKITLEKQNAYDNDLFLR